MQKILFGLVLLLCLLIIGEIIYLFVLDNPAINRKATSVTFVTPNPPAKPAALLTPMVISPPVSGDLPYDAMVNGLKLDYKLKQAGYLISTKSEYIYRFIISYVRTGDQVPQDVKAQGYVALLLYKTPQGLFGYYLSPEELQHVTVFAQQDGKQIPLKFADLKEGDLVQVKVVRELYVDPKTTPSQIEITKL